MSEQTFADEPRRVEITADPWKAAVVVDGTDMTTALRGYTLSQEVGQAPTVVLYPTPEHAAAFTGFARVQIAEPADPGPVVADFLRSINPAALDQAALQRDLDGSPNELTRAMLEQLIDWAEGRT